MKIVYIIEDTTKGIYPEVRWQGNGVTDNIETSLSMNLAAQISYLIRRSVEVGALKVVDRNTDFH